jgi:hypothetical protein
VGGGLHFSYGRATPGSYCANFRRDFVDSNLLGGSCFGLGRFSRNLGFERDLCFLRSFGHDIFPYFCYDKY